MLMQKIYDLSITKKLLIGVIDYLLFLGVNYFASMLSVKIIGNLISCLFAVVSAVIIIKTVKTPKLLEQRIHFSFGVNFVFICMLIIFLGLVVHPMNNIKEVLATSTISIISCTLAALAAGIFEEAFVRLLMFDGLAQLFNKQRYYLLQTSIVSAIIFGMLHLTNLSFQSWEATGQQIFYAIAIGLMLSFIRIQTNGIGLCMLFHSLIDFQPQLSQGSTSVNWGTLLLLFIPVIIISVWCIYHVNKHLYD